MSKHSNLCATKSKEKTMTNVMLKTALLGSVIFLIASQVFLIIKINETGGGSLAEFVGISVVPIFAYIGATILVKGK